MSGWGGLRALADAATPGPWTAWCAWSTGVKFGEHDEAGLVLAPTIFAGVHRDEYQANAALIVAMRNALPGLLDDHQRLTDAVDAVRKLAETWTVNDQHDYVSGEDMARDRMGQQILRALDGAS